MFGNKKYSCRRQYWRSWLLAIFLLEIGILNACAVESDQFEARKHAASTTKPEMRKVDPDKLIKALRNRNPSPDISNYSPKFIKSYDWNEYDRVDKAIIALVGHAEEAWPELLDHFDERRYCITYETEYGRNYTVGDICCIIVHQCLIQAYRERISPWFSSSKIEYPKSEKVYRILSRPEMLKDARDIRIWCQKRAGKPLYELQIEMCEWAIEKTKVFNDVSDEEREPLIKSIREEIARLRESKKAVPFPGFHGEEFGRYRPPETSASGTQSGVQNKCE